MGKLIAGMGKLGSGRSDRARGFLEKIVSLAKVNRNNEHIQSYTLCRGASDIADRFPEAFQHGNVKSEIPLCILLALKVHPNSKVVQREGCFALCSLLGTSCCVEYVFKFGGASTLASMLERDLEDYSIQRTIIEAVSDLSLEKGCERFMEALGGAGFCRIILSSMREHDHDEMVQYLGAQALGGIIENADNADHEILLVAESIDLLLENISLANKSQRGFSVSLIYICCRNLNSIMTKHPDTIPSVGKRGVPLICYAMKVHSDKDVLSSGIDVFYHLVDDEHLRKECFPYVVSALRGNHHDKAIRLSATQFLTESLHACDISSTMQDLFHIFQPKNLPFNLGLMEKYNDSEWDVQYYGCLLLDTLLCMDDTTIWEALQPLTVRVAKALLRAMKVTKPRSPAEEDIYMFALSALMSLLEESRNTASVVVDVVMKDEGALEAILFAMRYDPETCCGDEVGEETAFLRVGIILCTLAGELAGVPQDSVRMEIASHGGAEIILEGMKKHPDLESLQESGCKLLGMLTICKDPVVFKPIANADGVNIILDAIEKFPKNKTIFNYGGSAAILVREYEHQQEDLAKLNNNIPIVNK